MKKTSEMNPGHTHTCAAQLSGQCTIVVEEEIHEEACNHSRPHAQTVDPLHVHIETYCTVCNCDAICICTCSAGTTCI